MSLPPVIPLKSFYNADLPASGIWAYPTAIEQYRAIEFAQNLANVVTTLPAPFDSTIQVGIDVINTGTATIIVSGISVASGSASRMTWSGLAWLTTSLSATSVNRTQFFTATAGQTTFTLTIPPLNTSTVVMTVNGVNYIASSDITVLASVITWLNAFLLASSDVIYVKYT